jgi:hypothetical protein
MYKKMLIVAAIFSAFAFTAHAERVTYKETPQDYCGRDPGGETVNFGGKLTVAQCVAKYTKQVQASKSVSYVGKWNTKKALCRRDVDSGATLTVNNAEFYESSCRFKQKVQVKPNVWSVRAVCDSEGEKIPMDFDLVVEGDTLTVTYEADGSEQRYTRCN